MVTDTNREPAPINRGRRTLLLAGVAVAVVVVVGVVGWWLSRDDAPEAASLETATASVDQDGAASTTTAPTTTTTATDAAGAGTEAASTAGAGIEGDWIVDTSVGEFSFADSTGTFVGFRVAEELTGVGAVEAVGRTPGVSGAVTIEGTTASAALIEADMAAITTDDSRRDNRVKGAIDVDQFPTATFELTAPIEFGPGAAAGEPVSAVAAGDLTVHGVTQSVEFDLEAQLVDDTVVVVGSTEIMFSDFGVTVPSAPIVLSADDFGVVEFQLFLARS